MIIWLNGPHGVGKTTTAGLVVSRIPGARIFDPEHVGYILRPTLSEPRPVPDFREWPPWRAMVARAAVSIHDYLKSVVVMPQTVPEQNFWHEIRGEIETAGIHLVHVTLSSPTRPNTSTGSRTTRWSRRRSRACAGRR